MSLRRHKMVLEVEFLVADDENVETEANAVAKSILENIEGKESDGSSPCVSDVLIVSFDTEPLPPTDEEIAEDQAEAETEAARKAEVDAFLEKTPLRSPIGFYLLGTDDVFGTLQDVQAEHITVLAENGITMHVPRNRIDVIWADDGVLEDGDDDGSSDAN